MIYIGSDHAGYNLKEALRDFLVQNGYEVTDLGAHEYNKDDDYPDFIYPVARKVAEHPETDRGIVIGGSGEGEAMAANRVAGVRAFTFYGPVVPMGVVDIEGDRTNDPYEIVRLSRRHNNSNVLSIGARFVNKEEAKKAIRIWLQTDFGGAERHRRRIAKIDSPSS